MSTEPTTKPPAIPPLPTPDGWAPGVRFASREVAKLGAHFITNRRAGDVAMYEQGIGCERASKMLEEIARLMESQQQANQTGQARREENKA